MEGGVVNDQEDLALGEMLEQLVEEVQEADLIAAALEDLEHQRAVGTDRADHVGREALAGQRHDRALADRRVALAGGLPGAHAHLIAEQHPRPFAPRARLDRRELVLEPHPHPLGVLLEPPPLRLLAREPPAPQVDTDRLATEPEPEPPLDQRLDGLP